MLALVAAATLHAQIATDYGRSFRGVMDAHQSTRSRPFRQVTVAPTTGCTSANAGEFVTLSVTFDLYRCNGTSWALYSTGGGGLPTQTGQAGRYLTTDGSNPSWATIPGAAITSVFGRTGVVTAAEGDYQAFYPRLSQTYANPSWITSLAVGKLSGISGTANGTRFLRDDLSWADAPVLSAFGRTGSVTAAEADYQAFYPRLSQSYSDPSWLASLAASKLTGTMPLARLALCADGEIPKIVGGAWACAADASGGGGSSVTWRGAWSSGTTYAANDAVSLNGSSYVALQSGTNQNPATQPTFWALLAQAGSTGSQGPQGPTGPEGPQGPAGNPQNIADEGTTLTARSTLNFIGAGVSCVDNSGASRTDCTITSGGGSGTVTSIAFTAPSLFSVTGSPITTSGTIAMSLATQSANQIFAGPTSGGAAAPTFRALVAADLPATITSNTSGTSAALAANGANCATGSVAAGVDAAGAAEGCVVLAASATTDATNAANITSGTLAAARLPASVVRTDQANTFASGNKQTVTPSATTAGLNIGAAASVPSSPATGDMFFNTAQGRTNVYDGSTWRSTLFAPSSGTGAVSWNGSALTAGAISAADITSGTVATARLGSGTADSTTFLRGDGTWATPSGGGGGSPGGLSGQIQYNNAGAFGGFFGSISGAGTATEVTTWHNSTATTGVTRHLFRLGAANLQNSASAISPIAFAGSDGTVRAGLSLNSSNGLSVTDGAGNLGGITSGSLVVRAGHLGSSGGVAIIPQSGLSTDVGEFSPSSWRGASRGVNLTSAAGMSWSSTTALGGTADTGLCRSAAGVLAVADGTSCSSISTRDVVARSLTLSTTTARPTCDITRRSTLYITQGAAGVADTVAVCAKDASDAYAWRTIY